MSPRLRFLALLLALPVLSLSDLPFVGRWERAIAQTQSAQTNTPILDVTGVLEAGDRVMRSDNTLFDEYTFEGRAGQRVSIVMESLEFDTYLLLLDPTDKKIAENDDYQTSGNAALIVTLPQNGTHRILANAYGSWSRGRYRLTVIPTAPTQQEPILSATATEQMRAAQLNRQGVQFVNVSRFQEALPLFQQALTIGREIGDRSGEGGSLNNIGLVYNRLGQYPKALEHYQQALTIRREISDRSGEGGSLNNIGAVYNRLGQYPKALEYYQQALTILREISDRSGEGTTLNNIGLVYNRLGQYPKALEHYQQALTIRREISDRSGEGGSLNNIGAVYNHLGQYPKALEYYQQALTILREIGDRSGEGTTLNNIGLVYASLGQYPKALEHYQQALAINRGIGDRSGEGTTLNNIGAVYRSLGQYPKALEYYQQALAISRNIGDRSGEGTTLNNIGLVYASLGQYPKALEHYQQALAINRGIGDRSGEGIALSNIGGIYDSLGQYSKALEYYQQALAIGREIGDRSGEGVSLNNIGFVYHSLGQYQQVLEYYQQALAIGQEIGDRHGAGITMANIGRTLAQTQQLELAIVFYKQSINQLEEIRGNLRVLTVQQQQSFTDTVEKHYRRLADLLLQQNRILEAQRVLDLLKVQELQDYLGDVQRSDRTATGIPNREPEQRIQDGANAIFDNAVKLGRELAELEKIPREQRSPAQTNRIREIRAQQMRMIQEFSDFLTSDQVKQNIAQLRMTTGGQSINLEYANDLQTNLRNLQQNAVLLYPFVLDDRLELVLVTPDAPPIRRTVNVKREDLNRAIVAFRSALQNPQSDAVTPARQLYEWLIQPLENDLKAADAKTIIYAPDGALRYIPLAALHDGNQWLAQRFRVNNITAASLDDLNLLPRRNPSVFAGAFSEGSHSVQVGDRSIPFNGLTFAGREVDNLAALIPGTTQRLNRAFTPQTVLEMNDYAIVHLATHAAFIPGVPDASFILFGNGATVSLRQISSWILRDVDLVVLSACETGVGDELGDGREILGLGYQIQRTGAKAAIASLWQVSDGGTQMLMDTFYAALKRGMSKSEALRQAQIALITGDLRAIGGIRGDATIQAVRVRTGLPASVSDRLNHPYYWAPFILIGNGL